MLNVECSHGFIVRGTLVHGHYFRRLIDLLREIAWRWHIALLILFTSMATQAQSPTTLQQLLPVQPAPHEPTVSDDDPDSPARTTHRTRSALYSH